MKENTIQALAIGLFLGAAVIGIVITVIAQAGYYNLDSHEWHCQQLLASTCVEYVRNIH